MIEAVVLELVDPGIRLGVGAPHVAAHRGDGIGVQLLLDAVVDYLPSPLSGSGPSWLVLSGATSGPPHTGA